MKKIILTAILFIVIFDISVKAQETIKVMHYNLMYYGKNIYDCTSSNNSITNKNDYLKTIIKHVQPDIFSVNELDGEDKYPVANDDQYLLDNVLNVDGVGYFRTTESPNIFLSNIIYYNANKLVLKKYQPLQFTYAGLDKVFNAYKFYFNSNDLEVTHDTAFIYFVVAHLKAGGGSQELAQKSYETSLIMDYFESIGEKGNYIVMGDFNVYSPTEQCFQNLVNPSNSMYTFYDPANQIGEWSGNYDYRYYHTQSTHEYGECHSGGGMDDRFDFILASDYIMNGTDHFQYKSDSYKTIGQDGSRYNQSLNTTSNSVVPNSVAQALYYMSDHLPVYMELEVDQDLGEPLAVEENIPEDLQVTFNNPVNNILKMIINNQNLTKLDVEIYDMQGKKLIRTEQNNNSVSVNINVSDLVPAIYIVKVISEDNVIFTDKFIKN